jgi:hypothetical protein
MHTDADGHYYANSHMDLNTNINGDAYPVFYLDGNGNEHSVTIVHANGHGNGDTNRNANRNSNGNSNGHIEFDADGNAYIVFDTDAN